MPFGVQSLLRMSRFQSMIPLKPYTGKGFGDQFAETSAHGYFQDACTFMISNPQCRIYYPQSVDNFHQCAERKDAIPPFFL